MPKVSIVVPIYNVEKYIHPCVDSLLNQTLADIEIILVDDESPDRCPQICEEYKRQDTRIKVVHKKNGGLGFARNSGMEVATGEYIAFLDGDDYVDLETYQKLYSLVVEQQADIVYFAYERFNDEGYAYGHSDKDVVTDYKTTEYIRNLMLDMVGSPPDAKIERAIQVSSCCALYRKELIDNYQIRFHSERDLISEDLLFNLDYLLYASKVLTTPSTYYKYRINPVSLTQKIGKDKVERNYIFYTYLLEWLSANGFGNEGYLRATRLFIGYCRSSMRQYLKSSLPYKEKKKWLKNVLEKKFWKEIAIAYPYQHLPLKGKLYFYLSYKKCVRLLFCYSRLFEIIGR
jgi:glycosyltransferase involved in cell wall biosynthesis